MTMQSAVLLEPVEALDHSELPSLPTVTAGRRPAVVVQSRRGRPAPALVDVLGIHEMETVVVAADDDSLPDPGGSPLAIVTGADRLDETRASGRLAREQEWIRRADEAGTTVLGIGHGARVLALAFGGSVTPAEHPLRGWAMVDTVVPHVVPTGPWLTWQHDVITLPPDAVTLAQNRLGPQAFRLGRHLGVQFHPEATPEDVAGWAGALDAPEVRHLLDVVGRDPAAAADSTYRLLSSFIGDI